MAFSTFINTCTTRTGSNCSWYSPLQPFGELTCSLKDVGGHVGAVSTNREKATELEMWDTGDASECGLVEGNASEMGSRKRGKPG